MPGKKDYEKFTQRDLEERMKTASIDLMKSKVVAEAEEKKVKSRSASDHLRSLSKTRINSTMKWTDKVNFWLAKTVAELNGYLFILICLCGFIAGGLQLVQIDLQAGAGQFFLRVFLCTAMILSSILGGILACGYTAIICSMHKSLNQMSKVE